MITAEAILQAVEGLPYAGRVQHLVALGRRAATEPEVAAALADLAQGDFTARHLALFSCFTSHHREQVLHALDDPSRRIRELAARLLPVTGTSADFAQALAVVAAQARVALLWRLRKRNQMAIIDAYLATPAAQDDPHFLQLLPFGSGDFLNEQRERVMQSSDMAAWSRLARLHPNLALDLLEARVNADDLEDYTEKLIYALLPLVPESEEARVMALLTAFARRRSMQYRRLQPLVSRFPQAMAGYILAVTKEAEYIHLNFTGVVARLTNEQIVALMRHQGNRLYHDLLWLAQLPRERRSEILLAIRPFISDQHLSAKAVAVLPADLRLSETRRIMQNPHIPPRTRISYACFLPWDEALTVLEDPLHSADVDERVAALQVLVSALRYQPERAGEVLEMLQMRRSEQDHVRGMMIYALATLPPSRWQDEHLPLLTEIIRHGLNDVGLSDQTRQGMTQLLFRMAPFHPQWAAEQIATVLRERGIARPNWPVEELPPATRDVILAAVLPILAGWLVRGRADEALRILSDLVVGPLPDEADALLTTLLGTTRDLTLAGTALALLRRARPDHFKELVPELVKTDASWIFCPTVAAHLLQARQDLLGPFLGNQEHPGRFAKDGERFLLRLTFPATRLTTAQQETYAATLDSIIADPEQASGGQVRAIQTLALLPAITLARLQALANDPSTIVRTTALLALSHADTAAGLPTIIEALQDSRGRIAILALQRFLGEMSPGEALALLRAVPLTRVTLAKTVVRLIAAIPSEEAFQALLALEQSDLHRDVRVVLLEMLWHFPARVEIWPVMSTAVQSATKEIALAALPPQGVLANAALLRRAVGNVPLHTRVLELLLAGSKNPQLEMRTIAQWCQDIVIPDDARLIVPALIEYTITAPSDDIYALSQAIFTLCMAKDADVIAALFVARLAERHILEALLQTPSSMLDKNRARLTPICRAVLAILADDPILVELRAKFALDTLPETEFLAFLHAISREDLLHADALHALYTYVGRRTQRFTDDEWEDLRRQLTASADARLRRIAFAILLAQVARNWSQWTPEHIAALQAYRADPAPLVAAAAQFHQVPNLPDEA